MPAWRATSISVPSGAADSAAKCSPKCPVFSTATFAMNTQPEWTWGREWELAAERKRSCLQSVETSC
eukprot:SAG11_NODE_13591_length_648_cov_0.841530_2_plen_66_part_01